jgi:hypothetical protein
MPGEFRSAGAAVQIGDTTELRFTVQQSDSAQALELTADDSFPNVFATSRLVALQSRSVRRRGPNRRRHAHARRRDHEPVARRCGQARPLARLSLC